MTRAYEKAWWSFDLGEYRPCDGTYARYDDDNLPPLDTSMFSGSFQWLGRDATLVAHAAVEALGPGLPEAFVRFMSDHDLQELIPSVTACEWDLSNVAVASRVREGERTIRFLRDQQDCLFWYLLVGGPDDGRILCSPIPFDADARDEDDDQITSDDVWGNSWIVAASFEEFVYRFWFENVLWDLTAEGSARTEAQQAYLDWYRRH